MRSFRVVQTVWSTFASGRVTTVRESGSERTPANGPASLPSTGGPSTYAAPGAPPVDGSGAGPFAGVLSEPDSRTVVTRPDANVDQTVWTTLKDLTPSLVVNGLLYAGPSWMRFSDLVFSLVALVTAACWGVAELCWSPVAPLAYVRALRRRVARLN